MNGICLVCGCEYPLDEEHRNGGCCSVAHQRILTKQTQRGLVNERPMSVTYVARQISTPRVTPVANPRDERG